MQKEPQISILIANYNNGHFFRDAFQSLLNQTFVYWEAVVIDDASTDSSAAVVRQLIAEDPRFRFYENSRNIGYQKTIARAIGLSRAPVFGRLDPDDALHPDAIALSVANHLQHPHAGLVYSNLLVCDSSLNPMHVNKGRQVDPSSGATDFHNLDGAVWHFATFKRAFYGLTSGIDIFNRRAEDQDLYLKMAETAPMVYIDRELYLYRVHGMGASAGDNAGRAYYWHWVALTKMMERRKVDLEDLFTEQVVDRSALNRLIRKRDKELHWLRKTWIGRIATAWLHRK